MGWEVMGDWGLMSEGRSTVVADENMVIVAVGRCRLFVERRFGRSSRSESEYVEWFVELAMDVCRRMC